MSLVFNISQVGNNVSFIGTGSFNLSGFSKTISNGTAQVSVTPSGSQASFIIGPTFSVNYDGWETALSFTGPSSIGTGTTQINATSVGFLGSVFGFVLDTKTVILPVSYAGQTLNANALFGSKTIESMGLTVGTYVWTASNGDTITINVNSPTPTPTPTVTPTETPTPTVTPTPTPTPTETPYIPSYYNTTIVGYNPGSGDTLGEIVTFNAPHPIWSDGSNITKIQDNAVTLGGFNGLNN